MARELRLTNAPERVCLLRLSAIGDTCHVVPLLRRLRLAWPATHFTWIIGRLEARLMSLVPDVEFIIVDKRADRAAQRALARELRRRSWDVVLHLQVALRASRVARQLRAPVKLGFDRARARELQWLFTNARIAPRTREHVADSFQGFADTLGVPPCPLDFSLPLTDEAQDYARRLVPDGARVLAVSPCSSHTLRNWSAERYAAVIEAAHRDHGLATILCGGPSPTEAAMAAAIRNACRVPVIDQTGKDTLPQMQALLSRATVLLTPDSGPAHMGTAAGVPVVGLYAATNPARSGPYFSRRWCVDRYAEAARKFLKREPEELPWTRKIEQPGVMDLVTVDDVLERFAALREARLLESRA
jgi:heptosyltransferase I